MAATPEQQVVISWNDGIESVDIELSPTTATTGFIFASPSTPTVTAGDAALFDRLDDVVAPVQVVEDDWWGRAQEDLGEPTRAEPTPLPDLAPTMVKASNRKALSRWLEANGLELTDAAAEAVSQYAKSGWTLTLLSLAGAGQLAPIHVEFAVDRPVFPLRLAAATPGPTNYRMYVFDDSRTTIRQSPRVGRELNAARTVMWAGPVSDPALTTRGSYLTVTDLRLDDPQVQVTTDLGIVAARADDELIPSVVVYRPIELLGFPLGWLIVVWGGIGVLVGVGYLANRFRTR